jgi:hypothetical protein
MADSPGAIDLALLPNPFFRSRVEDAWAEAECDVPEIHREAFETCLSLLDKVSSAQNNAGLLLIGPPGAGKTHLLSRLRKYVMQHRPAAVFAYVRLLSSASQLSRFLRRRLVDNLRQLTLEGEPRLLSMLKAKGNTDEEFERYLEQAGFDYNFATVLRHYRMGRERLLCAQWLAGDSLPDSVLQRLDLGRETEDEDALEDRALDSLLRLLGLAAPQPVVFCFDQVEGLEAYPGDLRGIHAYAQLATAMHEAVPNLLLISCVQDYYYKNIAKKLHAAFQDRVFKYQALLHELNRDETGALLRARLQTIPALASSAAAGSLWPLRDEDFEPLFAQTEACEARRVIHHAEQVFESRRRGGALPAPEPPGRFLARRFEALREEALKQGTEALETTLAHGLPKLLALEGVQEQERRPEHARTVDLVFGGGRRATAVSFCHQTPAGLPRRLKCLLDAEVPGAYPRVVLLRPAALPIGAQAVKTREYLKTLEARGARLVQPPAEALAALDALRRLLADAQSGDLACAGQTVDITTVTQWLKDNLPGPLQRLLEEITGGETEETPASTPLARDLLDYVTERHVVRASQAAETLQASEEEILDCARRCCGQLGILAGPPAVLFTFVPEGFADESR